MSHFQVFHSENIQETFPCLLLSTDIEEIEVSAHAK